MEQFSPDQVSVPNHPDIFGSRIFLTLSVFLLIEILILGVAFRQLLPNFVVNPEISLWISGLCLIFFVIRGYLRLRVFQDIERQRISFVRLRNFRRIPGGTSSQSETCSQVSAITLIPHNVSIWCHLLCLLLFTLIFVTPLLINMLMVAGLFLFLVTTLLLVAFLVSLFAYIGLSSVKTKITIEATEGGLQMRKGGNPITRKYISWDEVCLFACYRLPLLFPGRRAVYYELSSPTQVIIWLALPEWSSPFTVWRPLLSVDEYRRQMQDLCELITAKTGLELRNLSK